MIRIAIVEDEEFYALQLENYLHQYEKEKGEGFAITHFKDGDTIVHTYRAQFDIILMDIQMAFLNGMSAAEEIRKIDKQVIIIFITNMKQYAIHGYMVDAMDYVVKPVSYFSFSEKLSRAINKMKRKTKKNIILTLHGGVARVDIADICYIESFGHTLIYHLVSGDYRGPMTMKEMEEKLRGECFFRGNKGYLINLAYVESVQDGCAIVRGDKLLLSRGKKHDFMSALTDYWAEVK